MRDPVIEDDNHSQGSPHGSTVDQERSKEASEYIEHGGSLRSLGNPGLSELYKDTTGRFR